MTDECDYCSYTCDLCGEYFFCSCQYRNHECKTEEYFKIESDDEMEETEPFESEIPTPWAVRCWRCAPGELIFMMQEFYLEQLRASSIGWVCPRCFRNASWSDENYDKYFEEESNNIFHNKTCTYCQKQAVILVLDVWLCEDHMNSDLTNIVEEIRKNG